MQSREDLREQMFKRIVAWQSSGLTQKRWCEAAGMNPATFQYWLRRWRARQDPPASPAFVPLTIRHETSAATASMELCLPDGRRLCFCELPAVAYLRELLS